MSKYGHRPYNWHEAIVNKMLGEGPAQAFLRDDLVLRPKAWGILPWKSIHLEGGPGRLLIKTMESMSVKMDQDTQSSIRDPRFVLPKTETDIDLIKVTGKELGFNSSFRYKEACDRAFNWGCGTCHFATGPQLRIQYTDQPNNELLIIATNFNYSTFIVWHDGEYMRIHMEVNYPDIIYEPEDTFIFHIL